MIYSNTNSYIYDDLSLLEETGVPIAFDFSTVWDDALLEQVCPHIKVALLSCAHLTAEEREREMKKAASYGVTLVVGTVGEDGSYALYDGEIVYAPAYKAETVLDTMGAGDSYFSTLLTTLLQENGALFVGDHNHMIAQLKHAMDCGAKFAAKVCSLEGAFGYGTAIID